MKNTTKFTTLMLAGLLATTGLSALPIEIISSDGQSFDFHTEFLPEKFAEYFPQMNKHNAHRLPLENVPSELMPKLLELFRCEQLLRRASKTLVLRTVAPILQDITDTEQAIGIFVLVEYFSLRPEFLVAAAFRLTELLEEGQLDLDEDSGLSQDARSIIRACHAIAKQDNSGFINDGRDPAWDPLGDTLKHPLVNHAEEIFLYGAHKDIPQARYNLGLCYQMKNNYKNAIHHMERAAEHDYAPALAFIGCYHSGTFIKANAPENWELAARYLKRAAKQNHLLSLAYYGGCLITKGDVKNAIAILRRAAAQNCAEAQFLLGGALLSADGADETTTAEALHNCKLAADQGYLVAQGIYGASLINHALQASGTVANVVHLEEAIHYFKLTLQQNEDLPRRVALLNIGNILMLFRMDSYVLKILNLIGDNELLDVSVQNLIRVIESNQPRPILTGEFQHLNTFMLDLAHIFMLLEMREDALSFLARAQPLNTAEMSEEERATAQCLASQLGLNLVDFWG